MTAQDYASPIASPGRSTPGLLEFAKYFISSGAALAVDAGLLAAGSHAGLAYPVSAAIGFIAGVIVAYLLSTRWVFEARSLENGFAEFTLFAAVGIAGLGLTELILWLAIDRFGASLALAKAGSAGCVFLFNFGARKALLFRRRAR